jgi:uncharacterized repeat protein (TIGR01451 family)
MMKNVRNLKFVTLLAVAATTAGGFAAATAFAAPLAMANNAVTLSSEAVIERTEVGADGKERTVAKQPKDVIVVPGDRVVFTLKYANNGAEPAKGFRATNPMPGPVQFVSVLENWAEVSVDGGASWGKLDQLKVSKDKPDGSGKELRAASPEDVTHVRWVFADAIAPGAKGSVSFRGLIK